MDADENLSAEPIETTDQEIFDSATSPDPIADEPATVDADAKPVEAEPDEAKEQPRDEQGKFVAKDKDAAPPAVEPPKPAEAEADDDKQGQIPSWRLREEREAKAEALKALEVEKTARAQHAAEMADLRRQLAQLQKPVEQKPEEEPDPLLDPKGFRDHIERKFSERLLNQQRDMDMRMAHRQHGELFEKAYNEAQNALAQGDVQLRALMNQTATPGDTLVDWYRQRQTLREVGPDPAAYRQKMLDEALKDPAYLAKAVEAARAAAGGTSANPSTNSRPKIELPPSLAGAARADAVAFDDNDISDAALFNHATRR